MTIEKNTWEITCTHTPETIDRVLLPIRKRGLCVNSLSYKTNADNKSALCTIEFEIDSADTERVYKNMIRLQDILEVKRK